MDDAVNVLVRLEHLVERRFVRDIEVDEVRLLAADELDAVEDLVGRVVEVVGDDHLVVVLEECEGSERPNVPGAPTMKS